MSCLRVRRVPPFDADHDDLSNDIEFQLLQDSPVTLFWQRTALSETAAQLTERGYHVVALDPSSWLGEEEMHRQLATAFGFPDYYGSNLSALIDCLRDVVVHDYGWPADSAGLAVTLVGYDAFASRSGDLAWRLLDILARASRDALLFGGRLVCLVQSEEPGTRIEPVGALSVGWNPGEWLTSSRGLQ